MVVSNWLKGVYRQLFPTAFTRHARQCRNRLRLRDRRIAPFAVIPAWIEQLEDRTLLSAVAWDGGAGDGLWTSADNWSGDSVPGANDDVTIDVAGDATITVRGVPAQVQSLLNYETLFVEGRADTGAAVLSTSGDL